MSLCSNHLLSLFLPFLSWINTGPAWIYSLVGWLGNQIS